MDSRLIGITVVAVLIVPLVILIFIGLQESETVEGVVTDKIHKERKCSMVIVYDPALNMSLPKEDCKGPYWTITVNNSNYKISKELYDKIKVDEHYRFSYHPMNGLIMNES